jgi:hypothetical protein
MYSSVQEILELLDSDLNFRAIASLGEQRILNKITLFMIV